MLTTLYEVGLINIILRKKKSTLRKIEELAQVHVPCKPMLFLYVVQCRHNYSKSH